MEASQSGLERPVETDVRKGGNSISTEDLTSRNLRQLTTTAGRATCVFLSNYCSAVLGSLTFSKEIRIPKISNCLAFYVFIDTKPGTKPEEIFKAVYGVNERHGDGQWMAAASSDGLVWKDLGPIWNRAKLIRSSSFIYAFDALNTVYYDNDIGRYVAYARSVKQWSSRGVMHASTSDFMNWPNKNWQEVEFDPPLKSGESLQ